MADEILVSVIVVTYNSEKYVIETLESVKAQTYKNIELIVTDDASTDNTIPIIKRWIDANKETFIKYKIVESHVNTGITPNCNRGILECSGDYIKFIAGDDLLLNNCLSYSLEYCLKNNLNFTYAKVIPFTESMNIDYVDKLVAYEKSTHSLFDMDVKQQYRELLKSFSMYTNGLFLKRKFLLELGCFDEKYKMMEDYPFAIKVTSMGYKLNLLDSYVVKYRVRLPESRKTFFASKRANMHANNLKKFQKKELLPRMKQEKMYLYMYEMYINMFANDINNFNDGILFSYLSRAIKYLKPSTISFKIKKVLLKLNINIS